MWRARLPIAQTSGLIRQRLLATPPTPSKSTDPTAKPTENSAAPGTVPGRVIQPTYAKQSSEPPKPPVEEPVEDPLQKKGKGMGLGGWLLLASLVGGNGYLWYREREQKGYIRHLMQGTYNKVAELVGQKPMGKPVDSTTETPVPHHISEDAAAEINAVLSSVGDIEVPSTPVEPSSSNEEASTPTSETASVAEPTPEPVPEPPKTAEELLKEAESIIEAKEAQLRELTKKCVDNLNALEQQSRKELHAAIVAQKEFTSEELNATHAAELKQRLDALAAEHATAMENALHQKGRELDAQHQLVFSEAQRSIHELQDAVAAYSQVKEMRERYAVRTGLAHSMSVAALALMRAVETRAPFANELEALKLAASAAGSAVTISAMHSVSPHIAMRGISSVHELQGRFADVSSAVREASYVPESGGLGWHMWAALVSRLQFREKNPLPESLEKMNPAERALVVAEKAVTEGRIEDAVKALKDLQGLSAQVAKDWLNEARDYLRVKIAIDVATAEATIISASFAR